MTGPGVKSFLIAVVPVGLALGLLVAEGAIPIAAAVLVACASAFGALFGVRRTRRVEQERLERLNRLSVETAAQAETLRQKVAVADRILSSIPDPLFFLDARRRVVRANAAARALVGHDLVGRDVGEGLRNPDLLTAVDRALAGAGAQQVEMLITGAVPATFIARVEPMEQGAAPAAPDRGAVELDAPSEPVLLIDLQDVTALIRSEQMRVDFVANVSHELRTPLTSLSGFIETLRGPAKDDAEAREKFLVIMQEQSERMFRLINDLLSLSRIESDEYSRPTARVDLAEIVGTVTDMLAHGAEEKQMALAVSVTGADGPPLVLGDADQLVQVFVNLIDNAIKYGRAGTSVEVAIRRRTDRRWDIEVVDTGVGIPADHIPRLTERFYRVDAARSRELGGTGLGLAIVKHIINRHRGRLSVTSREGEGSRFTVTLPAADGG
jgi:two-component system phosphate regulon sensor histidine kinase PhoR